jgi:hypothetical protein
MFAALCWAGSLGRHGDECSLRGIPLSCGGVPLDLMAQPISGPQCRYAAQHSARGWPNTRRCGCPYGHASWTRRQSILPAATLPGFLCVEASVFHPCCYMRQCSRCCQPPGEQGTQLHSGGVCSPPLCFRPPTAPCPITTTAAITLLTHDRASREGRQRLHTAAVTGGAIYLGSAGLLLSPASCKAFASLFHRQVA